MSSWIKCSDALPGDQYDGVAVIVAALNHAGQLISETDVWHKGRGEHRQGHFEFWTNTATHWQPLPSPPTE